MAAVCLERKFSSNVAEAGNDIYVPYRLSRHEHFILHNRYILADPMEYLLTGIPRTSRLHG